jgi:hypothetical protein
MDERLPAAGRIAIFAGKRYREFLMSYLYYRAIRSRCLWIISLSGSSRVGSSR